MPSPQQTRFLRDLIEASESTARLLGLEPPTYGGTPVLTEPVARCAQNIVNEWFTARGAARAHDYPTLYEPGHEGPMWVLSLEGGPEDWPMLIGDALGDTLRQLGVFIEPVNHWCLGLYVKS